MTKAKIMINSNAIDVLFDPKKIFFVLMMKIFLQQILHLSQNY